MYCFRYGDDYRHLHRLQITLNVQLITLQWLYAAYFVLLNTLLLVAVAFVQQNLFVPLEVLQINTKYTAYNTDQDCLGLNQISLFALWYMPKENRNLSYVDNEFDELLSSLNLLVCPTNNIIFYCYFAWNGCTHVTKWCEKWMSIIGISTNVTCYVIL